MSSFVVVLCSGIAFGCRDRGHPARIPLVSLCPTASAASSPNLRGADAVASEEQAVTRCGAPAARAGSGRGSGRAAQDASEKRKTSEKTNVFLDIATGGAAGAGCVFLWRPRSFPTTRSRGRATLPVRSPRGGTRFCASAVEMPGGTMDGATPFLVPLWKPPLRKWRDGCSGGSAPLPGVRHPAAPLRMPRGRDSGRREPQGEEAAWRAWWRMVRSSSFRPSSGREVRRPCRWRVTLSRRAALPASVWIAYCLASSRRMTNSLRTSDGSVAGGAASRSADSGAEGRSQEAAEKRRAAARAALHGIRLATAYSAAPPLTTR